MRIELEKERRERLIAAIKAFVAEELDQDIGDLKASMVLDFFLEDAAPLVYNQAVADAQQYLQARLEDMTGVVYAAEGGPRVR